MRQQNLQKEIDRLEKIANRGPEKISISERLATIYQIHELRAMLRAEVEAE